MSYIDGFVIPVPNDKREAYVASARKAAAIFKRLGAIRAVEWWGNDGPEGQATDFRKAVKAEAGQNGVFSWVEWPSKDARDKGNKAMMEDPEMKNMDMPFDGKRMFFGGFEILLDE